MTRKHFVHEVINIDEFINLNSKTTHLSESLNDLTIDCGDHFTIDDVVMGTYGIWDEFKALVKEKYHVTDKEIEAYKEDFQQEALRCISWKYRSNAECGVYADLTENIEKTAGHCSGFYYLDIDHKKCEQYECAFIVFYMTKKDYLARYGEDQQTYYHTKEGMIEGAENDFHEIISGNLAPIDWKHFDYYGSRFDSDGWQEYANDYCETFWEIKRNRKKHGEKVKAWILNKVPFIYRTATI